MAGLVGIQAMRAPEMRGPGELPAVSQLGARQGAERTWVWTWIAVILALTVLPYLLAALLAPPGMVFLGSLLNTDDTAQFLAAMRQGAEGNWLYSNRFTPESTRPVLMYPSYMLWGRMTGLVGLPPLVAYQALRVAGAGVLLVVAQQLAKWLLPENRVRPPWQTAFLLVAFSSGLSWLMAFLPQEIGTRFMADLALVEVSTFQTLFVVPHFAWGVALELLTFYCFFRAMSEREHAKRKWRWLLGAGLACLGVGLTYPFALVMVYAVLGVWTCFLLATGGSKASIAWWSAIPVVLLSLPVAVYYAIIFQFDPVWHSTHVAGGTTGSPPLLALVSGYGLVFVLAFAGIAWILRSGRWKDPKLSFLWVWAVVNGFLLYIPVSFQGRFAAGWHVALSMLASLGIGWAAHRLAYRRARLVHNVLVILTVPSTLLVLLAGPYMAISGGAYPFYLPRGEMQAIDWLAAHAEASDVVLASYALGNTIPTRASCRVFVGHQFSSYDLDTKLELLDAFFAGTTKDAERQLLLRTYGVTTVYYGSIERSLGPFHPEGASYLREIYRQDGVTIYAVENDDRS